MEWWLNWGKNAADGLPHYGDALAQLAHPKVKAPVGVPSMVIDRKQINFR